MNLMLYFGIRKLPEEALQSTQGASQIPPGDQVGPEAIFLVLSEASLAASRPPRGAPEPVNMGVNSMSPKFPRMCAQRSRVLPHAVLRPGLELPEVLRSL